MKTFLISLVLISVATGVIAQTEASYTFVYQAPPEPVSVVGIRTVSAYTLGSVTENDSSPCIGAYGDDLCKLAREGVDTCASNEFPKGTKLVVGDGYKCLVMDRMNSRYKTEIDLGMTSYDEAKMFGRNKLTVSIQK